jgi:PPP family 3-phenylpropionic acid transporter
MLSDRFGKNRWLFITSCVGIILSVWGMWATREYSLILLAASGIGLFISPVMSLLDSVTLRLLGDRRDLYGTYRVWGTVGFIVTSTTFGYLMDWLGYIVIFAGYAFIFVLFILVAFGLPDQPVGKSTVVFRGVKEIIKKPAWLLFAAVVFITWGASMGLAIFFNVFLKDLGSSDQLIGFTMAAAAVAELPVFPFSALFLRRLGSTRLMAIGIAGFSIRMLIISTLVNPAWGPAVNMLNAVSYVPFYMGAVAYASDVAPEHLRATSQGMLYAILNLANVLGAFVSGRLFDMIGPVQMYQLLAVCALLAFGFFVGGQFVFRRQNLESR